MVDIVGLYDTLLSAGVSATFRGIAFTMVDSSDETGRRALRFFFPGRDDSEFQDLGALDGQLQVTGLIVGDGYVRQAARMRAAFRTAGPGSLLHPWLGEMQVVLMQASPIVFSQTEYRLARFTCVFAPCKPRVPPTPDVLTQLLNDVDDLRVQASALLSQVLAPVGLALAVVGYAQSFLGQAAAIFDGLLGGSSAASVAASGAVAALAATAIATDGSAGAAVAAALAAPGDALVGISATLGPAAVGPATAAPAAPIDARVTSAILLGAVTSLAAAAASAPSPGSSLALAAAAIVVGQAVDAATDIAFASAQEAQATLASLTAAIDGVSALATQVAATQPVAAGLTWRVLQDVRSSVSATLQAEIGVLPAVVPLVIPSDVPAWIVAQALSCDSPAALVATLQDVVARNRLRGTHVPAGVIEVLR